MSDRTDPLAWMTRAGEDYALARSALRHKVPMTYGAIFHAQQCAEKYLKALLVAREQAFPRTHDLAALSNLMTSFSGCDWQALASRVASSWVRGSRSNW